MDRVGFVDVKKDVCEEDWLKRNRHARGEAGGELALVWDQGVPNQK